MKIYSNLQDRIHTYLRVQIILNTIAPQFWEGHKSRLMALDPFVTSPLQKFWNKLLQ